jgi:hypothetical protein
LLIALNKLHKIILANVHEVNGQCIKPHPYSTHVTQVGKFSAKSVQLKACNDDIVITNQIMTHEKSKTHSKLEGRWKC